MCISLFGPFFPKEVQANYTYMHLISNLLLCTSYLNWFVAFLAHVKEQLHVDDFVVFEFQANEMHIDAATVGWIFGSAPLVQIFSYSLSGKLVSLYKIHTHFLDCFY